MVDHSDITADSRNIGCTGRLADIDIHLCRNGLGRENMTREDFRKKYKDTVIAYTIWQVFTVGWFNIKQFLDNLKPEENMPGVYDCLQDYLKLSLTDQRWLMKRYL